MRFRTHHALEGKHALFGASQYHWVNYSDDKFEMVLDKKMSAWRGTKLHELAALAIQLDIKMPKNGKTLNRYVNDAIGFKMKPEVVLYYSENFFGTADAIAFDEKILRISDLKNGESPTKFTQLEIYAAYFCLEYRKNPNDFETELRIYQNDDARIHKPDPTTILNLMQRIKVLDSKIVERKKQMEG